MHDGDVLIHAGDLTQSGSLMELGATSNSELVTRATARN